MARSLVAHTLARAALGLGLISFWPGTTAQPPQPAASPPAQAAAFSAIEAQSRALSRAHAAVVGLTVQAVEGARTAATLGEEREGSGVVIGAYDLVLTIGYLVLEAQSV